MEWIITLLAMLLEVSLAVAEAIILQYGMELVIEWILKFMADMGF